MKKSNQSKDSSWNAGIGDTTQNQSNVPEHQLKTERDVTGGKDGQPAPEKKIKAGENSIKVRPDAIAPAEGQTRQDEKSTETETETSKDEPEQKEAGTTVIPPMGKPLAIMSGPEFEIMVAKIAMVCHDTNVAYCRSIGDNTQVNWEKAEIWQHQSAIDGVKFRLANPETNPMEQHEAWKADKIANGWVYGPVKNAVKKQHPCIIEFNLLPEAQRKKDVLFQAIVDILSGNRSI